MRADLSRVLSQYFFKKYPMRFALRKLLKASRLARASVALMTATQNVSQIKDLNDSVVGECTRDDVVHVRRQIWHCRDATQRRLGAPAALRFKRAPRAECAH